MPHSPDDILRLYEVFAPLGKGGVDALIFHS
jgi:hypothetical protein